MTYVYNNINYNIITCSDFRKKNYNYNNGEANNQINKSKPNQMNINVIMQY